ncbi:DMP19 family protein [Flavobacterium sp. W20_MBD1_R3]|uniref:DMP19 family protein n=1 Tax=Flavobacterium sp. W20_MBD1_R3 TaxID=3240278 RepID=UPI003F8ECEF7
MINSNMEQKLKYSIIDLQKASDENLASLIYQKATELEFETFGENLTIADIAMKEFLAIWVLQFEVENGGFDQFFLNYDLEFSEFVLSGLKRIGADDYKELIEKAIIVFKNQNLDFLNKRNPDFDKFDDFFYNLNGLQKLQIEYIRKNYEKFIIK